MKVFYVIVVAAALGAALGAGISWANFGNAPLQTFVIDAAPAAAGVGQAQVLVDQRSFDFGPVDRDSKAAHTFHFTNVGEAPLVLKPGRTSCSRCTIAKVSKTEVPPGETAEVTIEYLPTSAKPLFRQTATVLTNDPNQKRVELSIYGHVTSRYRVAPYDLAFSNVSADEAKTLDVKIFSFRPGDVKLVNYEFVGEETARYFEVQSEPLTPDQLTEKDSKGGCRVLVTLKPGLPLGAFRQTIRLELTMPGGDENVHVEVPIRGKIDSDVSIVGHGWNADYDKLTLGAVKSADGATRNLILVLRGPRRHEVEIKVKHLDPPWLRVSLGEPRELRKDSPGESGVTQIPLTIEVPPGSPPTNRLGSDQGKYGEIILDTTHAQLTQIRMFVQFVVEQ